MLQHGRMLYDRVCSTHDVGFLSRGVAIPKHKESKTLGAHNSKNPRLHKQHRTTVSFAWGSYSQTQGV